MHLGDEDDTCDIMKSPAVRGFIRLGKKEKRREKRIETEGEPAGFERT